MDRPALLSDWELVELALALAAELHRLRGLDQPVPGYRYDLALHPYHRQAWQGAIVAIAMTTGQDVAAAHAAIRALEEADAWKTHAAIAAAQDEDRRRKAAADADARV